LIPPPSETRVPQDFDRWLAEQAPLPVTRQLANLAAMLGPIVIGPLGGLLQAVFGG